MKVPREHAEQVGFAVFNGGPHTCIEVKENHETVSIRTPTGECITVAFILSQGIVDVSMGKDTESMDCCVLGAGPTYYASKVDDEPTIVTINYRKSK